MEHKNSSCIFTDVCTWADCFKRWLCFFLPVGVARRTCEPSHILHERKTTAPAMLDPGTFSHRTEHSTSLHIQAHFFPWLLHSFWTLKKTTFILITSFTRVLRWSYFRWLYLGLNSCNWRKENVSAPYLSEAGLSYHWLLNCEEYKMTSVPAEKQLAYCPFRNVKWQPYTRIRCQMHFEFVFPKKYLWVTSTSRL